MFTFSIGLLILTIIFVYLHVGGHCRWLHFELAKNTIWEEWKCWWDPPAASALTTWRPCGMIY
jgi:hypothetical protein